MTLVKFNNRTLPNTFNNFLGEFFNELPATLSRESNLTPVNIYETENAYQLELNAPGRTKDDFQVSLEKELLTISFEKKEEVKSEERKTIRKEFSINAFKRSFSIDERIDAEKIEAKYENGVLSFTLPKKEEVKQSPKNISVQ